MASILNSTLAMRPAWQLNPKESGQGFAADIVRRMRGAAEALAASANPDNAAPSQAAPEAPENSSPAAKGEQLRKLESSLSSLVNWMEEKHGAKAATAMMGIVYKSLGNQEVNEENLSQAFLDVTRFIDNNFGFDAGDQFLNQLNGTLNQSLNDYFDNGKNEQFFAVTNGQISGIPASPTLDASEISANMAETIMKLIEEARLKNNDPSGNTIYAGTPQKYLGLLQDMII